MTMTKAETLAELLTNNRSVRRTISYLEGENSERVVAYGGWASGRFQHGVCMNRWCSAWKLTW